MKPYFFLLIVILSIGLVSASECPIGVYPCDERVQFLNPDIEVGISLADANTSLNGSFWTSSTDQTGLTGTKAGDYKLETSTRAILNDGISMIDNDIYPDGSGNIVFRSDNINQFWEDIHLFDGTNFNIVLGSDGSAEFNYEHVNVDFSIHGNELQDLFKAQSSNNHIIMINSEYDFSDTTADFTNNNIITTSTICDTNGCIGDLTNPFDQSLNTTDNVNFNQITIDTDGVISHTGSDLKIQGNAVTSTDGVILQGDNVAISSTGVIPTSLNKLKIVMDSDDIRGLYIDGTTNDFTTANTGSYLINAEREINFNGVEYGAQSAMRIELNDKSVDAQLTESKESSPLHFRTRNEGLHTSDKTTAVNEYSYGIFNEVWDTGTYDNKNSGAYNVVQYGFRSAFNTGGVTLSQSAGGTPTNNYNRYASSNEITTSPTIDSGTWTVRNYGNWININTVAKFNYGLYITAVTGGTSGNWGIYDNSGTAWKLDDDNAEILIGESGTELELKVDSDGATGLITSATGLRLGTNTEVTGDLNVTKNITGNQIYGQMGEKFGWDTPLVVTFDDDGVYYNVTNMTFTDLNGFKYTNANQSTGGSYLTAQVSGFYEAKAHFSGAGSASGGAYGIVIVENFNKSINEENCYTHIDGLASSQGFSIVCAFDLEIGDTVNIQVEDEMDPTKNIEISSHNLLIIRIGH